MRITHTQKVDLGTVLCHSKASSNTVEQCHPSTSCLWKANSSCHRGTARYARRGAGHLFAQHAAPPLTSSDCTPKGKQRFWSVPVYPPLFSENISLSRPKMSLKAWALEDTFVRQGTHERGDQLFYFWRCCPSSQEANLHCTSHRGERPNVLLSVLGSPFVLSWEGKVCDGTHEKEDTLPTMCLHRRRAELRKAPSLPGYVSGSSCFRSGSCLQLCQGAESTNKIRFPRPLMSPALWNLTLLTQAVHRSVSASMSVLSLCSDSARQLHLHFSLCLFDRATKDTPKAVFNPIRHALKLKYAFKC